MNSQTPFARVPGDAKLSFSTALAFVLAGTLAMAFIVATAYANVLPAHELTFDLTVLSVAFLIAGLITYLACRFRPKDPGARFFRTRDWEKPPPYKGSWLLERSRTLASWKGIEEKNPKELRNLRQFLKDELGIQWALHGTVEVVPDGSDAMKMNSVVISLTRDSSKAVVRITPVQIDNRNEILVKVESELVKKAKKDSREELRFPAGITGGNKRKISVIFPLHDALEDIFQRKRGKESEAQELKMSERLTSRITGCISYESDEGQRLRYELNWLKKSDISKDAGSSKVWYRIRELSSDMVEVLQNRRNKIIDDNEPSATTLGLNEFSETYTRMRSVRDLADKAIRTLAFDHFLDWACLLVFIPVSVLLALVTGHVLGDIGEFGYLWQSSILLVAGVSVVSFYPLMVYASGQLRRDTEGVLGYLWGGLASAFLLAVVFAALMARAIFAIPQFVFNSSQSYILNFLANPVDKVMTAAVGTLVGIILLRDMVTYGLTRASGTQPLIYDEALVSAVERIVVLYGLIIASGLIVVGFGVAPAADTTIIYLLLLSVITAVIGYASRETLENFFAGLILRINPPFRKGDRVMITQGELSDVREIGVRTTRLYDVESHTEIYYPNKNLVDQRIVNVSRPDPQLRVSSSIFIRAQKGVDLHKAKLILMDIAYAEDEVEQALIDRTDLGTFSPDSDTMRQLEDKVRVKVEDEVKDLMRRFPEIRNVDVPITVNMKRRSRKFRAIAAEVLKTLKEARPDYIKDNPEQRYAKVGKRAQAIQDLSNAIFALSDEHPELREEFEPLLAELSREPMVHSEFGQGTIKLTLHVFIQHLEMRMHVESRLNEDILARLSKELPRLDFSIEGPKNGKPPGKSGDTPDAQSEGGAAISARTSAAANPSKQG